MTRSTLLALAWLAYALLACLTSALCFVMLPHALTRAAEHAIAVGAFGSMAAMAFGFVMALRVKP